MVIAKKPLTSALVKVPFGSELFLCLRAVGPGLTLVHGNI